MSLWAAVGRHIGAATGSSFTVQLKQTVSGGCINSTYRLQDGERSYFLKLNDDYRFPMFEAEAEGLLEIAATETVKVPRPICWGVADKHSYLVLEYLSLSGNRGASMDSLGRQLALLHQTSCSYFGWHRDNTIGSTPQINTPCENWVIFWRQHRLGFQLNLAAQNGYKGALQSKGEHLMAELAAFFKNYKLIPALLHGDLWSGNMACDEQSCPIIFDPAAYYGDRETDLAMTELFGGFSPRFYAAYQEAYPLSEGYKVRKALYQLYHILNHLNLFGNGYSIQAERMMDSLLAVLR